MKHPDENRLLAGNRELHGRYQGQRCFILGNGPSLADERLSELHGETIFTVNNLVSSSLDGPDPTFHVVSDRRFFSVDRSNRNDQVVYDALWGIMSGESARTGLKPTTFVPSSEHEFFNSSSGSQAPDVRYFCNPYYFSDYYWMSTDLTHVVPRFSSVIQHAVLFALSLGFRHIYLLGCDATNIVANVNTALQASTSDSYAYEVSDDLDLWFREQFAKRDMERCAESYLEALVAFRFLAAYCSKRGVQLVNCSSRTVLDSIPRMRLLDVL